MTLYQRILGALLGLLLAGTLLVWWRTAAELPTAAGNAGATASAAVGSETTDQVDRSAYNTALRLKGLATGATEQALADSAMRLADHDLDLAFTAALRQLDAHPPQLSAAAQRIAARLQRSQQQYADGQRRIDALTAEIGRATPARKAELQDELDLEKSQLELDQYEIEEANQDLDDAGGNLRQRIEAESQEREQQEKLRTTQAIAAAAAPEVLHGGLVSDFRQWRTLSSTRRLLQDAQQQSATLSAALARQRQALAAQLDSEKSGVSSLAQHSRAAREGAPSPPAAPTAPVAVSAPRTHAGSQDLQAETHSIAADQNVLTLLEQRHRAQRLLSGVYRQWGAAVAARTRAAVHMLASGACVVTALLLLLLFMDRWLHRAFAHGKHDRRRVETLHSISRTVLQLLAIVILLLMLFGLPNQFGTVLGIVGAGLTVALKDFIVAFIGWGVLMGRNGMRLGDWVEINGVSGEVIELGMFHTVLLETGSWGDTGHPTGRRVTFTNSFAISGHYFNFSTSGQWLWDELLLVVPQGRDPQPIIDAMREQAAAATAESARQAETEWQRAVPSQSSRAFSGTPSINARPVVGGVEVSVRYIIRADERFQLRSKLYQAAVSLLGESAAHAVPAAAAATVPAASPA
jgi:small-conductance mechanosensitive channel